MTDLLLEQIRRTATPITSEFGGQVNGPPTSGSVSEAPTFKLFSIDEVLSLPSPEWRVEGLLPVGALSMIYAPQEQFKTFFGLDLALSVAHGPDFHGRKVKRGPTVYILGEGSGGLKNRVKAWMKQHGVKDVEGAFVVLEAVQFKRPDDVETLKAQITARNLKPAMLFIDTFARCAVGVDENDARHVGEWIDAVTKLQHEMGVDVVA
ncbi:MAG: AAA family ATPase, partial [Deltaproteobacteria bacterium]|nr:AAA family ATPase [Deltaproteobacteria bacterium]